MTEQPKPQRLREPPAPWRHISTAPIRPTRPYIVAFRIRTSVMAMEVMPTAKSHRNGVATEWYPANGDDRSTNLGEALAWQHMPDVQDLWEYHT